MVFSYVRTLVNDKEIVLSSRCARDYNSTGNVGKNRIMLMDVDICIRVCYDVSVDEMFIYVEILHSKFLVFLWKIVYKKQVMLLELSSIYKMSIIEFAHFNLIINSYAKISFYRIEI